MSAVAYALITPAHNEEDYIEETIHAVANQDSRPMKWVIVNDSSTDRTGDVLARLSQRYPFIEAIHLERDPGRNFGRKAVAFGRGLEELKGCAYDFIGNLDADITVENGYFAGLFRKFEQDPKLGIAGGIVYTKIGENFVTQDQTLDSVGGAVQMFRRSCFEQVGGYLPLELGGIDAAAEITARMKGWKVAKFPELIAYERRRTGSAGAKPIQAKWREGRRFYSLGYGPLFYAFRCGYRLKDRPLILGSMAEFAGYLGSLIRRKPHALSPQVVAFLRAEQRGKLKAMFLRLGTGSSRRR